MAPSAKECGNFYKNKSTGRRQAWKLDLNGYTKSKDTGTFWVQESTKTNHFGGIDQRKKNRGEMIGPYPPKGKSRFGSVWLTRKDRLATKMLHPHPTWRPTPSCLLTVVDSKRRAVGIVRLRHPKKHPFHPTLSTLLSQNKHMNTFPASATTTLLLLLSNVSSFRLLFVAPQKKTKGMSLESLKTLVKKVSKNQTSSPGFSWSGSASAEPESFFLLPVGRWNDL